VSRWGAEVAETTRDGGSRKKTREDGEQRLKKDRRL
jgi:hypothetical protein